MIYGLKGAAVGFVLGFVFCTMFYMFYFPYPSAGPFWGLAFFGLDGAPPGCLIGFISGFFAGLAGRRHALGWFVAIFLLIAGAALLVVLTPGKNASTDGDLSVACYDGKVVWVDLLLVWGADPNTNYAGRGSALMAVVNGEHMAIVGKLISAGADPNAGYGRDWGGPLSAAIYKGDVPMIRYLISKGANAKLKNASDESIFLNALRAMQDH